MSDRLTDLAARLEIQLVAIDGNRNVRRSYWTCRSQDLFGWHIVAWAWGRLGSEPKRRIRAFSDEQAAIAFSRHLLGRRVRRTGTSAWPIVLRIR